tara:strand:- start:926 stop:1099 length:174 start_codon:yes stop_codon:yes gene_type:complete
VRDEIVESGEFAETQMQRPPDQYSSISRIYRIKVPPLERLERREQPKALGGEFVVMD